MISPLLNKLVDWFILVNWFNVLVVIIGSFSVLAGIFINEYFKRKDRASLFSKEIFQKKLDIYEELFNRMWDAYERNNEIIEDKNLSKEKRDEKWHPVALSVISFLDRHKLYISEGLAIHCMLTLVGAENLGVMPKDEKSKYYKNRNETINLIKEESGLKRLDKFLSKINKPKIESDYITYYNKIKKGTEKENN